MPYDKLTNPLDLEVRLTSAEVSAIGAALVAVLAHEANDEKTFLSMVDLVKLALSPVEVTALVEEFFDTALSMFSTDEIEPHLSDTVTRLGALQKRLEERRDSLVVERFARLASQPLVNDPGTSTEGKD